MLLINPCFCILWNVYLRKLILQVYETVIIMCPLAHCQWCKYCISTVQVVTFTLLEKDIYYSYLSILH